MSEEVLEQVAVETKTESEIIRKRKPEKPGAAMKRMRRLRKRRKKERLARERAERLEKQNLARLEMGLPAVASETEKKDKIEIVTVAEQEAPFLPLPHQIKESDPSVSEQFQADLEPIPVESTVTAEATQEPVVALEAAPAPVQAVVPELEQAAAQTQAEPQVQATRPVVEFSEDAIKVLVVFNELVKSGLTIEEALTEVPESDFEPEGTSDEEKAAHRASVIAESIEKWGSNKEVLDLLLERSGLSVSL